MKTLRILIPKIKPPTVPDIVTSQITNILSELKTHFDLNITWLIFQPYKFSNYKHNDSEIVDFHNFCNAIDAIETIKPDLVFMESILGIHGIAFSFACKSKRIPLVTITTTGISKSTKTLFAIKSSFRLIFSNHVLGEIDQTKEKKFGMLRYSLTRYRFLLRTLRKLNYGFWFLFKFILFYPAFQIFSKYYVTFHPINSGDLNICLNNNYYQRMFKAGFDKNSLFLAGDPGYDSFYNISHSLLNSYKHKSKNFEILFCPSPMHEHGMMSKSNEHKLILDIINYIKQFNDVTLSIKIHPSSASKEEYVKLLHEHNFSGKIYHKENIIDLILNTDVVLNYGSSSVVLDSILLKKPVIMILLNNPEFDRLYDDRIILGCKKISELPKLISKAKQFQYDPNNLENYIKNQIGIFDGNNSERIAKKIFEFLKTKNII